MARHTAPHTGHTSPAGRVLGAGAVPTGTEAAATADSRPSPPSPPSPPARWQRADQRAAARAGATVLLVASGGGHLSELHALCDRVTAGDERLVWITEDTAQARSLLQGHEVVRVPKVSPRSLRPMLANVPIAASLLRSLRPERVISTGAGIALSYLPAARLAGVPAHYVESAARLDGPSLTGRLLDRVPGIHRYTQAPRWENKRWHYRGSVFDGFAPLPLPARPSPIRNVVVALGTMPRHRFDRLVDHIDRILPPDVDVLWQLGCTTTTPRRGTAAAIVPWRDLDDAVREADVVIAHAGVGTALQALAAGKMPILVPRRAAYGEHVDDHQVQIADDLSRRGLAVACEAGELSFEHLHRAATTAVERCGALDPYRLDGPTTAVTSGGHPAAGRAAA